MKSSNAIAGKVVCGWTERCPPPKPKSGKRKFQARDHKRYRRDFGAVRKAQDLRGSVIFCYSCEQSRRWMLNITSSTHAHEMRLPGLQGVVHSSQLKSFMHGAIPDEPMYMSTTSEYIHTSNQGGKQVLLQSQSRNAPSTSPTIQPSYQTTSTPHLASPKSSESPEIPSQ